MESYKTEEEYFDDSKAIDDPPQEQIHDDA